MADVVDYAQLLEAQHRAAALSAQESARAPQAVNESGRCRDCGDPIAPGRLAGNPCAQRCIDCQTDFEIHRRHFGTRR